MRKEWIVNRQGKDFILYAGILDLAHENGLKSIITSLVQAPDTENAQTAIVTALVTMEKDGQERLFSGIGDASPRNVAPAMQQCLLRMAETRAKARALRDAVNIGEAAFEELGVEEKQEQPEQNLDIRKRLIATKHAFTPEEISQALCLSLVLAQDCFNASGKLNLKGLSDKEMLKLIAFVESLKEKSE